MYLHIGGEAVVKKDSVIGIFDLDNISQSHLTRKYLAAAENAGEVQNEAEDLPKSIVLCSENGRQRVYLSQLSSATLLGRSGGTGVE